MTNNGSGDSGSVLNRLRAERTQALKEHFLTLEVPGWSGMLHVRYHPIPWEEMTKIGQTNDSDPAKILIANIDALVTSCDALLVAENGEMRTLADVLREQGEVVHTEVKFDEVAAEALGLETSGARDTVRAVFGSAISPELAISDHASKIAEWMTGVAKEVDETLVKG